MFFCMKFSMFKSCYLTAIGDEGIRTPDPLLARQVLSQLSYTPKLVGLRRLELPTSRLSGVRSNRLSYKPLGASSFDSCSKSLDLLYICDTLSDVTIFLSWRPPILPHRLQCSTVGRLRLNHRVRDENGCFP